MFSAPQQSVDSGFRRLGCQQCQATLRMLKASSPSTLLQSVGIQPELPAQFLAMFMHPVGQGPGTQRLLIGTQQVQDQPLDLGPGQDGVTQHPPRGLKQRLAQSGRQGQHDRGTAGQGTAKPPNQVVEDVLFRAAGIPRYVPVVHTQVAGSRGQVVDMNWPHSIAQRTRQGKDRESAHRPRDVVNDDVPAPEQGVGAQYGMGQTAARRYRSTAALPAK